MKDEINLLPPPVIQTRTQQIYLIRLGQLQRFIVVLLVAIGLALGGVWAVAWHVGKILDQQENEALASHAELVNRVTSLNEQVGAIQNWRLAHEPWTPLLPEVFAAMPSGVHLTEMELERTSGSLTLKGSFTSRESLVAFQRQLQQLSWISSVEAPLSNFEVGNQEEFTFKIFRKNQS